MEEIEDLREQLADYRQEHEELDDRIGQIIGTPPVDFIQVQRLKKKKLWLKDMIQQIESDLIDDIIA